MARLPLETIFQWQTCSAVRRVSTQNICFFSPNLKKKKKLAAQHLSLSLSNGKCSGTNRNRNQIAEAVLP